MDSEYPIGICTEMCPDEEIIRREREGLLHTLEILPSIKNCRRPKADINRVVKEFSRSAAGRVIQNVKELRTPDALLRTVDYLLHDVTTRHDVQWNVRYDYIMDRLRAVRQDMVIQNVPRSIYISLLQPMIKFYVYSAYRLCEEPISKFDPVINNTHLQECLKRLLCFYDDMDILVSKVCKRNGDLKYNNNLLYSNCRPFMESLYLILNMSNTTAMQRALLLPDIWKSTLVRKCFKISIECWRKNYVRVCREMITLPPLLAACAVLHLPFIRKNALDIMSTSYSCRNITFPADKLQNLFLYNDVEELYHNCTYYGISTINSNIVFSKSTFNKNKPLLSPKHSKIIDEELSKYNIPDLLLEDLI